MAKITRRVNVSVDESGGNYRITVDPWSVRLSAASEVRTRWVVTGTGAAVGTDVRVTAKDPSTIPYTELGSAGSALVIPIVAGAANDETARNWKSDVEGRRHRYNITVQVGGSSVVIDPDMDVDE